MSGSRTWRWRTPRSDRAKNAERAQSELRPCAFRRENWSCEGCCEGVAGDVFGAEFARRFFLWLMANLLSFGIEKDFWEFSQTPRRARPKMNAAFAGALALQIRRTDPLWGKLEDFAIAFRR